MCGPLSPSIERSLRVAKVTVFVRRAIEGVKVERQLSPDAYDALVRNNGNWEYTVGDDDLAILGESAGIAENEELATVVVRTGA
jgi:hypothetical protein